MKNYLFLSTKVYARIDPPPITMIKKEVDIKDKNTIKIKIQRSPNITNSKTYEFKIGTFDSGNLDEFLQLLTNFDEAVVRTGTPSTVGKIAFLRTLLWCKALQKYDLIFATFGGTTEINI